MELTEITEATETSAKTLLKELGVNISALALNNVVSAVVILLLSLLIIKVLMRLLGKLLEHSRLDKTLHVFIQSASKAVLYILMGIMVLSSLGVDATSLVAVLSVAGLAVSLAMQNSLSNLAGGILLLITKPFVVGDYIEAAGHSGTVQEINLIYTQINTLDNKRISIPNSTISGSDITNYSTEGKRRVDLTFTASYDNGVEEVQSALLLAIGRVNGVLPDPAPFARVSNYLESSVEYTVRVWCVTADYWNVHYDVIAEVKRAFDERGIEMTYNHLNVHMIAP